ncbi:cell adhesion molecule DSCAML1-like [Panonychus citri]|nr:cell adhesion molecule DSCAML1-like [Panonychus citri]
MYLWITFAWLSFIATLSFGQEVPKINPFLPSIKPVIGGKTSFYCQSLSGSSPLHVTWFKDDKEIHDSSFIRIKSNEDPSVLIIETIQSSHSGNYTCRMSNKLGYDSYTTELLVQGSPNWIEKPKDITAHSGDTLTVNCSASGYPKPKIEWKRLQGSSW